MKLKFNLICALQIEVKFKLKWKGIQYNNRPKLRMNHEFFRKKLLCMNEL